MAISYKINMDSIRSKLDSHIKSDGFKSDAYAKTKAEMDRLADEAGQQMVSCYHNAIMSSSLTDGGLSVVASAGEASYSVSDNGNGEYNVEVTIPTAYRVSLVPERYGGIDDMVALMNNGYTANDYVHGVWPGHGDDVWSLIERDGAHFVEQAVEDFKSSNTDGVVSVDYDHGRFHQ